MKPDGVTETAWDAGMRAAVEMEVHAALGTTTVEKAEVLSRAIMAETDSSRQNFLTMQNTAAQLLKRAERAEETLAFVHRWAWEKDGNGTSDNERLSAIKHHPAIRKLGNPS